MTGNIISFLWGLAEATLFFIIPDVGLSVIALKGRESGLTAALYALAGALTGGAIMYTWGKADLKKVSRILHRIPAIPAKDIEKVQADLRTSGVVAILMGPLFGIPYKIYASFAHSITSIFSFLLISIPARGIRFVFVALATPYFFGKFLPNASYTIQAQLLIGIWIIVYVFYFFFKRK